METPEANIQLDVPVLLITYRRLGTTKQVFSTIKKVKPKKLYVSSNAANNEEEVVKVNDVRNYVLNNVDWECELITLFRTEHVSARHSIAGAIDWLFENEETGIILEDDCCPDLSFFYFCAEMLDRYRYVTNVMQISGYNILGGEHPGKSNYLFSHFGWAWGWATWKRAWVHFDSNMSSWLEFKRQYLRLSFPKLWLSKPFPQFYSDRIYTFDKTYERYRSDDSIGSFDTWDYQWHYAIASNSGFSVVPRENLITNIGFGKDATHGTDSSAGKRFQIPIKSLTFPLKHPQFLFPDLDYDYKLIRRAENSRSLYSRAIRHLAYLKYQWFTKDGR